MELDEHVPIYVSEPKHPEYHAPSDDDIQVEDHPHADDASPTAESPGYIADSDSIGEDDDEDLEEDLNETAVTPPPPRHHGARISVRPQTPMAASTQALIDAFAVGSPLFPLPPNSPAYDQAPLESSAAAARAPRGQYDFIDTVEAGHGLIRSPGHDAHTIARAADRAEDIGYTDCKDIRLEINVVRGHRTVYETELQEVRQVCLSFEARNRALLARLETLETHMSRVEWQRQSTEDLAVTQMMRIHTLEARARTDTVKDAGSSC
nr:hypothetical protein [Tanacetum cinerariifolium]